MVDKPRKPILYGPDGKPLNGETETLRLSTKGRSKQRQQQQGLLQILNKPRLFLKFVPKSLSVFVALCTIVGLLLYLVPRVSVVPSDPVEIGNPFSASFTITPSNIFPLRNVGACVGTIEIDVLPRTFSQEKRPPITNVTNITCITEQDWNNHNLSADEKFTITPYTTFMPGDQFAVLAGADIAIVVDYQPWFIPIRRRQAFRFVTHRFSDGSYRWYSYPLD